MTSKQHDLVVRSAIIRSEKPNKGLEATAAPNPNQMNRLVGYFTTGEKVMIAQRPGKGGMDFNKLLGGKVFAVAADGISPVFEKGPDKKPTKNIKQEEGLPLYSTSGFYLLSSKEYPALDMFGAYTKLINNGAQVLILRPEQVKSVQVIQLESEFDLEILSGALEEALSDSLNLVACFDVDTNKRRSRGVSRAKEEADDSGEPYGGVSYKELAVSKKDGNPFVLLSWQIGEKTCSAVLVREAEVTEDDRVVTKYYTPTEAVEHFIQSSDGAQLTQLLDSGHAVTLSYVQGHLMRTSVSFRRKAENVLAADPTKAVYGDAVYIKGALAGWCKGLVSLMHSMHPNFPQADYDAHHYVAAVRQAEIGMNKKTDGQGWTPPEIIFYDVPRLLLQ
jgi:hypothetical protein